MSERPILVWIRRDLRLADNPALSAAAATERPLVILFVDGPDEDRCNATGSASRWWLHQSLSGFRHALQESGGELTVRRGRTADVIRELQAETKFNSIYFNSRYEPVGRAVDQAVVEDAKAHGIAVRRFVGSVLADPGSVLTQGGTPYRVFTAWYKALLKQPPPRQPLPAPDTLTCFRAVEGLRIDDLQLLPRFMWYAGLHEAWSPGETAAHQAVSDFAPQVGEYGSRRDTPSDTGTSRLSPHLHFGEISPRQVWHAVGRDVQPGSADEYRRQLGWRDFAIQLLVHFPETVTQPLLPQFQAFPWREDSEALVAWQRGQTGYPLVDAGMRQLWHTGWMHNRVRMVAGSFLVKHLLLDWRHGARWFADTLVDADLANNTMGWQWVGGSGADAAPYFRVFNPIRQSERFDGSGAYIKSWVPELRKLESRSIHAPWDASGDVLHAAGVRLGDNYPRPIVDHKTARQRALDAYATMRRSGAPAEESPVGSTQHAASGS
jgi:deoxyribodipyrimidine photo-lyase